MDRIEYEEWALKGIDPALGPTPWSKVVEKKGAKEGKVSTSSRSRATDGDFGPGERFRVKERGNGALWDEKRGREELVRASGAWRTFAHVGTAGLGRQLLPRKPPESQLTSAPILPHPSTYRLRSYIRQRSSLPGPYSTRSRLNLRIASHTTGVPCGSAFCTFFPLYLTATRRRSSSLNVFLIPFRSGAPLTFPFAIIPIVPK